MRAMASPTPFFVQLLILAQIKVNIEAPRHWPLCGEFTGHRWIPHSKGRKCGKCFNLMTSSWLAKICWHCVFPTLSRTCSNAFYWKKSQALRFKFHRTMFLRIHLTKGHHWIKLMAWNCVCDKSLHDPVMTQILDACVRLLTQVYGICDCNVTFWTTVYYNTTYLMTIKLTTMVW